MKFKSQIERKIVYKPSTSLFLARVVSALEVRPPPVDHHLSVKNR